jgi:hypothetical protein
MQTIYKSRKGEKMSSVPGVKDEVRVDGETKIGGFRFQKYLKERVVHIHNPEDERVEYPIKDFVKDLDKFILRLKDFQAEETIRLRDLKATFLKSGKIELELKGCKDSIDMHILQNKMNEFMKILEK